MSIPPHLRECNWTDSGDSNHSSDEKSHPLNNFGIFPPPIPKLRAKRGPIIPFHFEEQESSRMFLQQCLIGSILDLRRFSVETMQRLINRAWQLREGITIIGRDGNNYIFHFNNPNDRRFMLLNGPWSINGALLIFEIWQPNTPLRSHSITNTLWVQLWRLPLEYQQPIFACRIAQAISELSLVDWDSVVLRTLDL
ncbi:hypothetical protein CRYUN_Cryun22dG0061200 [Craigia yunnanensis]